MYKNLCIVNMIGTTEFALGRGRVSLPMEAVPHPQKLPSEKQPKQRFEGTYQKTPLEGDTDLHVGLHVLSHPKMG